MLPLEFVSHMVVVFVFICSEYKILHKVMLFDSILMIFNKFNISFICMSLHTFPTVWLNLSNYICWETSMHFSLFRNLHPSSITDFPKLKKFRFSILENRYRLTYCIALGGCHSVLHNTSLRIIIPKLKWWLGFLYLEQYILKQYLGYWCQPVSVTEEENSDISLWMDDPGDYWRHGVVEKKLVGSYHLVCRGLRVMDTDNSGTG